MTPTETELVERVVQWVRQNSPMKEQADSLISPDTDLFATGLLDSLGFVDLITFIESHEGCRVDLIDADPSEFVTVKGLCRLALGNSRGTGCQSSS